MKSAHPHNVKTDALDQRRHSTTPDFFSYLLPTQVAPILPKSGTFKHKALVAVIADPTTQLDFKYSWRLAAYIEELIKDGWAIASDWVTVAGCHAPIKRYWIDLQDPATSAGVAALNRQRGFIAPHLLGLLGVAVPVVAVLVGIAARYL